MKEITLETGTKVKVNSDGLVICDFLGDEVHLTFEEVSTLFAIAQHIQAKNLLGEVT